jgi:predicted N-acyltransferase
MGVEILASVDDVRAADWNSLGLSGNPFLRHEFLGGMERHGCVGRATGWIPQHLVARDGDRLLGAVPLYLKHNSYGELVFDWSWADAYERLGLRYYPKLVAAIPYSPITGPRLLVSPSAERTAVAQLLMSGAREHALRLGVSSLHWLFPTEQDAQALEAARYLRRTGYQFHWTNKGYRDFSDLLSEFSAAKRKKIRRERRYVEEAGIETEILHGGEVTDVQWQVMHQFYRDTFDRRGGWPTLTLEFFQSLSQTMPDNVVLVLAKRAGRYVAGAFNLRSEEVLYGRHWGCAADFHSLHFEVCYYRGLDYCIEQGLRRFEAGAQGEHKLSRGFLPVRTYSNHWLAHDGMRRAVADFLARERPAVDRYLEELSEHVPFKQTA